MACIDLPLIRELSWKCGTFISNLPELEVNLHSPMHQSHDCNGCSCHLIPGVRVEGQAIELMALVEIPRTCFTLGWLVLIKYGACR